MVLALALIWIGFVLVVAGRLVASCRRPGLDAPSVRDRPRWFARPRSWVAEPHRAAPVLGRTLRRAAGRPPDPAADRRLGLACLVASPVVTGLLVTGGVPLALLAALAAGVWYVWHGRQTRRKGEAAVIAELPEVVDLLVLAVASGLTVPLAVAAVASRAPPSLAPPLGVVARAVHDGVRTADALELLPALVGDPAWPLVSTLVSAVRYGVPVGPALEKLASEVRFDRRRRADEAARRVPVKLLFPLVLCALPAFALLTVVPLLVGTLRSLPL